MHETIFGVARWTEIICHTTLGIAGLVISVLMLRKKEMRSDCLLVTLSILITLIGILSLPDSLLWTHDHDAPDWAYSMKAVSDFLSCMVHWIFPIMIWKTARNVELIFSKECTERQKSKV